MSPHLAVHVVDLGEKPDLLRRTVVDAATSRFMMDQFRVWRPDDPVAGLAQPQAKIDVIESDREILIEAAELQVDFPPHHRASSGYRGKILR